jgi:lipoprotein signal peptidase
VIVLAAAAATLAIDAASKAVVTSVLVDGRVRVLHNRRAALSITHTSVLLVVIAGVVFAAAPRGLTAIGLGMAVGGAAGNLLDRIRHGAVVDFVAAWRWPVFNLADTAMTVGLVLAAVSVL